MIVENLAFRRHTIVCCLPWVFGDFENDCRKKQKGPGSLVPRVYLDGVQIKSLRCPADLFTFCPIECLPEMLGGIGLTSLSVT